MVAPSGLLGVHSFPNSWQLDGDEALEFRSRGRQRVVAVLDRVGDAFEDGDEVVGDLIDGLFAVMAFFAVAVVIATFLLFLYTRCLRSTVMVNSITLVAVVWQLGLLTLLGFGIDPMSILVPFLIFAIGVSHGVQMVSAVRAEIFLGADGLDTIFGDNGEIELSDGTVQRIVTTETTLSDTWSYKPMWIVTGRWTPFGGN